MTKIPLMSSQRCEEVDDEDCFLSIEKYAGEIWLSDAPRPTGIRGAVIDLNGKLDSNLDWSKQIAQAKNIVAEGIKVLWRLDLGLFDKLVHPLSDEGQLLSLKLSLQHFRETIWEEFQKETIAVQIYQGCVTFNDVTRVLGNDDPYHRRDVAADYLTLLTVSVPEDLRVVLKLKAPFEMSSSMIVALLNPDRFEKMEWILEAKAPLHSSWHQVDDLLIPNPHNTYHTGFCIPFPEWMPTAECVLDRLLQKVPHLRLIPEGAITSQWDQLDELYVIEKYLTPFGKRQLQGFIAAGGTVIEITR